MQKLTQKLTYDNNDNFSINETFFKLKNVLRSTCFRRWLISNVLNDFFCFRFYQFLTRDNYSNWHLTFFFINKAINRFRRFINVILAKKIVYHQFIDSQSSSNQKNLQFSSFLNNINIIITQKQLQQIINVAINSYIQKHSIASNFLNFFDFSNFINF